jgi:hypothetical protein
MRNWDMSNSCWFLLQYHPHIGPLKALERCVIMRCRMQAPQLLDYPQSCGQNPVAASFQKRNVTSTPERGMCFKMLKGHSFE